MPDYNPMSLLVWVGCEEKFSWCVCSGFGLCMGCKHTWDVADPELAACWPPPHELAQHGSWKKLGHHGPPPPQVGGAAWVLPGVLTYIRHELCRKPKLLLRLLADSFSCFARIFNSKAFLQGFWILHASGSFFFHHRCTWKINLSGFLVYLLYHDFGFFQQAVEQIILWSLAC